MNEEGRVKLAAVVLAGGHSRRFGADKLAADLEGLSLLERAVSELPADTHLIIVGPNRDIRRPATFIREESPGTGPAAGLIAGLRLALSTDTEAIVVLPGDAPAAGRAAMELLSTLRSGSAQAVLAVDTSGRAQPLQLALRPPAARALVAAAGESAAAGQSARRLVDRMSPPPLRVAVSAEGAFDIDTADQLLTWQLRDSPAVRAVLDILDARGIPSDQRPSGDRAYVIAIDGPSGAGKSTVAAALTLRLPATVLDADDFYSTHLPALDQSAREAMSDAEAAASIMDWRRLRAEALTPLRSRHAACYAPFDWEASDGSFGPPTTVAAADVVIMEGVYSGRPELADLVDLRILLEVPAEVRSRRLAQRADPPDLARFWDRAEQHYFAEICPPPSFDLRLSADQLGNVEHA